MAYSSVVSRYCLLPLPDLLLKSHQEQSEGHIPEWMQMVLWTAIKMNIKTVLLLQISRWFGTYLFRGFSCANEIIAIFNHECTMPEKGMKIVWHYNGRRTIIVIFLNICLFDISLSLILSIVVRRMWDHDGRHKASMYIWPEVSFCSGNGLVPSQKPWWLRSKAPHVIIRP